MSGYTNIIDAFPLPIFIAKLDDEVIKEVKDIILPKIKKLKLTGNKEVYSDYFNERVVSPKELEGFFKTIHTATKNYCSDASINFQSKIDYWVQDYKEGNRHSRHNHGNHKVSGVYFVRANSKAGNFVLENPILQLLSTIPGNISIDTAKYFSSTYSIKPEEGTLILFPSFLYHWAEPSSKGARRTIFAFNVL